LLFGLRFESGDKRQKAVIQFLLRGFRFLNFIRNDSPVYAINGWLGFGSGAGRTAPGK
jgi:hypothetical protein